MRRAALALLLAACAPRPPAPAPAQEPEPCRELALRVLRERIALVVVDVAHARAAGWASRATREQELAGLREEYRRLAREGCGLDEK